MDDRGPPAEWGIVGLARRLAAGRWRWLILGMVLLAVSNGRWIVPPATWLAPIGWLVFVDRSRLRSGLVAALVGYVAVQFVMWWGVIPAPGTLYFLIAAIYGVVYFIPLALHRALSPHLPGIRATLVFPLAWVSVELVFQRWGTPYGSWASLAYTQADHLALVQLVSVTGTAGPSFLITWFGSVAAWLLRPGRDRPLRARVAGVYALALAGVLAFGQMRLWLPEPGGELTRIAGLVPSPELMGRLGEAMAPALRGEPLADPQTIGAIATELNEGLLARTLREARAGARLVVWSEAASRVSGTTEAALVERAARIASEEDIYIVLALGVWNADAEPHLENKLVAVRPDGSVAWQHHKAHPVVGAESLLDPGDGVLGALDAPFGRIGAVICHDLDFPRLLRQSSGQRIGLMLGPSADWPLIAELHANMARLRAVESGFSLFRPTQGGRSIATDTRGRTLAQVDFTRDAVVAHVRAAPARTVFGIVGDLFAWLCVAGVVALTATARRPA